MATKWKTICCPVDFSEPTLAALTVAADLCSRLGSNLVLLHVDGAGKVAEELAGGELVDTALAVWKADAQRMGAVERHLAARERSGRDRHRRPRGEERRRPHRHGDARAHGSGEDARGLGDRERRAKRRAAPC